MSIRGKGSTANRISGAATHRIEATKSVARKGVTSTAKRGRAIAESSFKAGRAVGAGTTVAAETARRFASDAAGRTRSRKAPVMLAGAAGAAGAYFFDPDSGNRRRAIARDKVGSFFRQGGRRAGRTARQTAQRAAGTARGAVAEATPSPRDPGELNDPALQNKVQSEIFRDADAPKGAVNVNVEDGVVYLRGELATGDDIEELVEAAARVEGVRGVENLLHLPGEEAPSKGNGARRSRSRTS
jgi:osmotically-inducible protein OsmY